MYLPVLVVLIIPVYYNQRIPARKDEMPTPHTYKYVVDIQCYIVHTWDTLVSCVYWCGYLVFQYTRLQENPPAWSNGKNDGVSDFVNLSLLKRLHSVSPQAGQ